MQNKRIVLCVTGGIAAYKAAEVASSLVQQGANVDVVLTDAAMRFVGPLTFEAITDRPVHTSVFTAWGNGWHGHVTLGHEADLIAVVPATADAMSRIASGAASDMMGAVVLSTTAPVLIAPAMEHNMFHNPATQRNLQLCRDLGHQVIGPEAGRLASGDYGDGRLASPDEIVGTIRLILGKQGRLRGRRLVVTAGGTQEAWDPVRFLGNRSSGKMGFAVAQAAIDAGASVTLIAGPVTQVTPPVGVHYITVVSARDMQEAVNDQVGDADILVMAAAVADYRPAIATDDKVKKNLDVNYVDLPLTRNPDILKELSNSDLIKIGFAAETSGLEAQALSKLREKGLDLIIANDAVSTIDAADAEVTMYWPDGRSLLIERRPKHEVAELIVDQVSHLLHERG